VDKIHDPDEEKGMCDCGKTEAVALACARQNSIPCQIASGWSSWKRKPRQQLHYIVTQYNSTL